MSGVTEQFKCAFCQITDIAPENVINFRADISDNKTIFYVTIIATDEMLIALKAEMPEAEQPETEQ